MNAATETIKKNLCIDQPRITPQPCRIYFSVNVQRVHIKERADCSYAHSQLKTGREATGRKLYRKGEVSPAAMVQPLLQLNAEHTEQ